MVGNVPQVFLNRPDEVACVHEPFCDAYHMGPEKMSRRFDERQRVESGFSQSTYRIVLNNIQKACEEVNPF